MTPELRSVDGCPDYAVSADGRVWSKRKGHGWQELSLSPNGIPGYLKVKVIDTRGRVLTRKVHVLVAAAFIGPRPLGLDVNHLDGDKSNNAARNLEYCSRSRNMRHSYEIGIRQSPRRPPKPKQMRLRIRRPQDPETVRRGEQLSQAKLTEIDVRLIRRRVEAGCQQKILAAEYGVTRATISKIVRRVKWAHVA